MTEHHRHHAAPQGHKFSLRALVDDKTVGVAIVGRPVGRHQDDGTTLEITRLCTDGTRNAVSFLVGAVKRAARALGYSRLISYTLISENGASWRASGMKQTATTPGGNWTGAGTQAQRGSGGIQNLLPDIIGERYPQGEKRRWEIRL